MASASEFPDTLRSALQEGRQSFIRGGWVDGLQAQLLEEPTTLIGSADELAGGLHHLIWLTPREAAIAEALLHSACVAASLALSSSDNDLPSRLMARAASLWETGWLQGISGTWTASHCAAACTGALAVLHDHAAPDLLSDGEALAQEAVSSFDPQRPPSQQAISIPVLLTNQVGGYVARLEMESYLNCCSHLLPDPRTSAFLAVDEAFQRGIRVAWTWASRRQLLPRGTAVRWRLLLAEGQGVDMRQVTGGSLTAAAATGLLALANPDSPPISQDWAITGGLSAEGELTGVGEYATKVRAATSESLGVMVPIADAEAVISQSLAGSVGRVVGIRTPDEAYDLLLRPSLSGSPWGLSAMALSRRELIYGGLGVLAGGVGLAKRHPRSMDHGVRRLQEMTSSYERWYWDTDPADLIDQVESHLGSALSKLRHVSAQAQGNLIRVATRSALLAGRIEFFDLRDPQRARQHLGTALSLANEADDDELLAIVLGHFSFLPGWVGDVHAKHYLDRAHAAARRRASGLTRAWLHAIDSEISGKLYVSGSAPLRHLDDAARILQRAGDDRPDWLDFFDATRLEGFRGGALLAAGQLREARSVFRLVRQDLPANASKQLVITLADEAMVALKEGEPDEAATLLLNAHELLLEIPYEMGSERLRGTISELETKFDSSAVRELFKVTRGDSA